MLNEKIVHLLKSEFNLHPEAQLVDYYKLFFQGTFGPAHIIQDKKKAETALKNELKDAVDFDNIDKQNVSYINNYYRVNINLINKNIFTFDNFFDAFLKSTEVEIAFYHDDWLSEWKRIKQEILKQNIPIVNFEEQAAELDKKITAGKLVSHSPVFRSTYNPHYRLISEKQLRKLNC